MKKHISARWAAIAASVVMGLTAHNADAADPNKVIRVAFEATDDGFDSVRTTNAYTNWVSEAIFERLLTYDYLARPAKLIPEAAEALPVVSEGGKVFTFKIRKGVYFSPDPAFKGARRELTAEDYIFTMKRSQDPQLRAQTAAFLSDKILGFDEMNAAAKKANKLDYDAPVAGLKAIDKYTLRIELKEPDYTFAYIIAATPFGAQAREVVEAYGDQVGSHPVGTGPYMLKQYVPRSKVVLESNPNYRGFVWDAQPNPGDAWDAKIVKDMKGKKMPQIGRVEITYIEEEQPRQLAFEDRQTDYDKLTQVGAPRFLDGDKLKPEWAAKGITLERVVEPEITYHFFNINDPVIGGMGKEKIALRRAIALSYPEADEIRIIRKGQAKQAQMLVPEGVQGHDPTYKSTIQHNPDLAAKLLDQFGYKKGPDGWRTTPEGKPLVITFHGESNDPGPQYQELWKKSLTAIGLKSEHKLSRFADNLKDAKKCLLPIWGQAWHADFPEGENFAQLFYGPNSMISNNSCYKSAEYDALYKKAVALPLGPERFKLYKDMSRKLEADTALFLQSSRIRNWVIYPWVQGFKKHPILNAPWAYMDVLPRK